MDAEKAATTKISKPNKKITTTTKKKQVKIIVRYSLLDHLSKDLPKAISRSGYSNMRSQQRRWISSRGQVPGHYRRHCSGPHDGPMTGMTAILSDPSHETGDVSGASSTLIQVSGALKNKTKQKKKKKKQY